MQPSDLLSIQRRCQKGSEKSGDIQAQGDSTFLHIVTQNSDFLIPIEEVKEVSEMPLLRPYPFPAEGHLGIVNLRGNVLPVLSMEGFFKLSAPVKSEDLDDPAKNRLVVFHHSEGESFGIRVEAIKKVTLPKSTLAQLGGAKTLTLGDRPAQMISKTEILEKRKVAA